ncbi:MAG: hypothetical protein CBC71_06270 [Rhodobacteraceae bacterium TMED111]|nr:hypothetical protein [Marinovum sp.]OUV41104.1 MAG: hypothetical protein CBC71_06270 [Rhodobacteraceae bacterium TMED111]|tara:strand:+ start:16750 stop:17004 length:255 start_codon:yes stop_codon:yes gene_type:complete
MINKYITYILITGVSIGLVWLYGNAKYNQGASDEKLVCAVISAEAGKQSSKDWNDISEKLQNTSKEHDLNILRSFGDSVYHKGD